MTVAYRITPELRVELKEPFGILIEGTSAQTMAKLEALIAQHKPPKLISVGDVVSQNLHAHHLHPQLSIIDYISLRDQVMPREKAEVEKTVNVKNPQGTITEEAAAAVKDALAQEGHIHIVVEGEEDLLVLVAVKYAPKNAFVVYGQPRCGVVVVQVTDEKKAKVQRFLKAMNIKEKGRYALKVR